MNNKFNSKDVGLGKVVETLDKTASSVFKETDKVINPVRETAAKRFPTLFLLAVTFGVSAVVFSFEIILTEWTYLYERPWLILFIGITILVLTGRLYRKLD